MTPRFVMRWLWRDYFARHIWLLLAALVLMIVEGAMVGAVSYMV